jgi:hypothetical protein
MIAQRPARLPLVAMLATLLLLTAVSVVVPARPEYRSNKPVVCFRNVEGNPRTASLFERETLNRFGSEFHYLMAPRAKRLLAPCNYTVLLVEHSANSDTVRSFGVFSVQQEGEPKQQVAVCAGFAGRPG